MSKSFSRYWLLFLFIPGFAFSQGTPSGQPDIAVNRVARSFTVTKEKLTAATSLADLNRYYKSEWVRSYISVEVLTCLEGNIRKTVSKNDRLTNEQKEMMTTADVGSEIAVSVQYMPENNLKQNEPKEIRFSFTIDPESEAAYPGGPEKLKQYLQGNIIDEIPDGTFTNYDLVAVTFTIDETGQIINPRVFSSTEQESIDALLLKSIRAMPAWKPAAYANGVKVKQDFALTVGSQENCMLNLLSVRME